jgi:hypothetical protein
VFVYVLLTCHLQDSNLLMRLERKEPKNILTLYFICYYYIRISYVITFYIYVKRNWILGSGINYNMSVMGSENGELNRIFVP